jgi:hypothetical protein
LLVSQSAVEGVEALDRDGCKIADLSDGLVGWGSVSWRSPFLFKLDPCIELAIRPVVLAAKTHNQYFGVKSA